MSTAGIETGAPPPRRAEIAAGVRASFAAGLGMFPLGIAFGLLVAQSPLPWWMAPALSILGFAGSLELLMIGLLSAVTPLATVALTTLLVNFRHVFYAFSFPLHVLRGRAAKTYSMYSLCDEAYAVTAATPGQWSPWRLIALQASFQVYWISGGLVGVFAGGLIPFQIEGLEFAMCALFITLTLDACRNRGQLPSLLLGALSFAAAVVVVPEQALFGGMLLFVAALVVRYLIARRRMHG